MSIDIIPSDIWSIIFSFITLSRNSNLVGYLSTCKLLRNLFLHYADSTFVQDRLLLIFRDYPKSIHLLLTNKHTNKENLLIYSTKKQYYELVKLILEDEQVNPNKAFLDAICGKNIQLFQLFLQHPRIDLSYMANLTINLACVRGKREVIEILLKDPRVDPSMRFESNFNYLVLREQYELIKLLFSDPRVKSKKRNIDYDGLIKAGKTKLIKLLVEDMSRGSSVHRTKFSSM